MKIKSKDVSVAIYMDHINYLGDVTDSVLIAGFRNMSWASPFINQVKADYEDEQYKIRVEVEE